MYKCLNCGHLFEQGEQKKINEIIGETFNGVKFYIERSLCPCCLSEEYKHLNACKFCWEWITDSDNDGDICNECKNEIKNRFSIFLEKHFTKEEIKALNIRLGEQTDLENKLIVNNMIKNGKGLLPLATNK